MNKDERDKLAKAAQDGCQAVRDIQTNPDAIKTWLSQGISAPTILTKLDESMSLVPEFYQPGDAEMVSAQIKRLGAEH
jgi:hypothetical protein